MAREQPDRPARAALAPEEIELLHTLLRAPGHKPVPTPSGPAAQSPSPTDRAVPDIRPVVIDLGRLVGWHPSKSQPLPGAKKVWQGLERLNWAVLVRDALGERKQE